MVQLARLVLGLSSLAVLPARSRQIDDQSGCLIFVKHHLEFRSPTMAQASTLVPVTKMKKAQAWTLALS